jgi:ribosomal protein L37AE/L43A
MKPFYGTAQHTTWIDVERRGNDPWDTWVCHVCGAERTGAIIKDCENCGTYPRWRYERPLFAVAKTVIKMAIIRVLYRVINVLKNLINRLDDDSHF